jgi:hypothetical protein
MDGGAAQTTRRRETTGRRGAEQRRRLVAAMVLRRLTVREMVAELASLPARERPGSFSVATLWRDVQALKAEWAAARAAEVAQLVDEEVVRLNELEKVWWPRALGTDREATDRVLAIQRQRAQYLRIGPGARGRVAVEAEPVGEANGEREPVTAVKVRVELVDDWRNA